MPFLANAAEGDCEPSGQAHTNTNGLKRYKVNLESASLYGYTDVEALTSVMLGADTWNEYGNGGYFEYLGTTTETDANCAAGYSVVRFTDECGDLGHAGQRYVGDQFKITLRRRHPTCNYIGPACGTGTNNVLVYANRSEIKCAKDEADTAQSS